MSQIAIVNPAPGGRRYTSLSRARNYVGRGRAVIEGNRLRFLEAPQAFLARLAAAEEEASFRAHRGERVYWNGSCNPNLMMLPGTVRS